MQLRDRTSNVLVTVVLTLLVLLHFAMACRYREVGGDFSQDYIAAHTALSGSSMYSTAEWMSHPPTAALLGLLFVPFEPDSAFVTFSVLSFAFFLLVVWKLSGNFYSDCVTRLIVTVVSALNWQALAATGLGSISHLVSALVLLGILSENRSRTFVASTCIAFATALKLYPVIAIVSVGASRDWRPVVVGVSTLLILFGITGLFFQPGETGIYFSKVLPENTAYYIDLPQNLSLSGVVEKLFGAEGGWSIPLIAAPAFARILRIAIAVILFGGFIDASFRRGFPLSQSVSFAFLTVFLASPITWGHYLGLLVLPILQLWTATRGRMMRTSLLTIICILGAPPQLMSTAEYAKDAVSLYAAPFLAQSAALFVLWALFLRQFSVQSSHSSNS